MDIDIHGLQVSHDIQVPHDIQVVGRNARHDIQEMDIDIHGLQRPVDVGETMKGGIPHHLEVPPHVDSA